ncbi:MAG: protease SohB [Myxococcota bacterium]
MDVLWDTLSFAAKAGIVFLTVSATALVIFALMRRGRRDPSGVRVKRVNDRLQRNADHVRVAVMGAKPFKKFRKRRAKQEKKAGKPTASVFVLDFRGDVVASAVANLRQEVTALLAVAGKDDEVVVRLESTGGVMHDYGLAASQLARFKDNEVRLTVCVDKVAASGGYMMACVADEILAAPFAIVGSIGVAAPVPNLHRLLDRHGIDYDEMTAGEYKRTVSMLAEITDKGREKFQEQIEDAHGLFKEFIAEKRPALDLGKVATGEYWYATRALELGLVNRLTTSDDYLVSKLDHAQIFEVSYEKPRRLRERLAQSVSSAVVGTVIALWTRLDRARFQ